MRRGVLTVSVVFWGMVAFCDEVYLKGGGKVSGRIVQRTENLVEVEVGAGKVGVPANRVERIVEGRSALDGYYERAGRLGPADREGWAALGRWASDQGLPSQAREAYHRVLAVDPNDAEANRALGNVQANGRWMTEEDGYRARGYVQFEGEWMTPAEQARLQREQAAQADSDRARAMAEARARQAEQRAAEDAEARAKQAAVAQQETPGIPLWWGWGPGPVLWPTPPVPTHPIAVPR
jgi:hypothetical protein